MGRDPGSVGIPFTPTDKSHAAGMRRYEGSLLQSLSGSSHSYLFLGGTFGF